MYFHESSSFAALPWTCNKYNERVTDRKHLNKKLYMIPRAETGLFTIYQIELVGQLMNPILNYPLSHTNKTQCSLKHKQLIMVINTHTPVVAVRRMVPFRFELPFPSLTLLNYLNLFTLLMWEFHSLPSQDLLPFKNCSVIHDGS